MDEQSHDVHPSIARTLLIALLGVVVANGYVLVFLIWGNS